MKNWKTTIGGTVAALGTVLSASDNHTHKIIGLIATGLGMLLLGGAAKDNNVTGGTVKQD